MTDITTKLLGIEDDTINILSIKTHGKFKDIVVERTLEPQYCPFCQFRMYSKGCRERTVNHPILQDGLALRIILKQRRFKCQNTECGYLMQESFSFVEKRKRNTNATDLMIVNAFRDYNSSVKQIAKRFNVSDTYAYYTFLRYVDMKRRSMPEALCIDEVYLGISKNKKYALVLQDFQNNEPVDLVISRRESDTNPYFSDIPIKERNRVKYLITDMYAPYAAYIEKYFYHAVHVVDSFHVIALINRKFNNYILAILREVNERDRKEYYERLDKFHITYEFEHSKEYYLLKKYRWLLLSKPENIKSYGWKYDSKFKREMCISDYFEELLKLNSNFKEIYDLKQKYIDFNSKYEGDPKRAKKALDELIEEYSNSHLRMYREIADSLNTFRNAIIMSFTLVEKYNKELKTTTITRLSNGPIESLNRIPKDMKRHARGFKNFEFFRNRFLFAKRVNAGILGKPKALDQVRFYRRAKRGKYLKHNIFRK